MIWFVLLIAVVLVVLTTAAVLGRVDGSLAEATTSMSHDPLPATPLTPGDFEDLHFDTAMRGYRMNQVDDVIDRLRREISDLDDELSRVRGRAPSVAATESNPTESNPTESTATESTATESNPTESPVVVATPAGVSATPQPGAAGPAHDAP